MNSQEGFRSQASILFFFFNLTRNPFLMHDFVTKAIAQPLFPNCQSRTPSSLTAKEKEKKKPRLVRVHQFPLNHRHPRQNSRYVDSNIDENDLSPPLLLNPLSPSLSHTHSSTHYINISPPTRSSPPGIAHAVWRGTFRPAWRSISCTQQIDYQTAWASWRLRSCCCSGWCLGSTTGDPRAWLVLRTSMAGILFCLRSFVFC